MGRLGILSGWGDFGATSFELNTDKATASLRARLCSVGFEVGFGFEEAGFEGAGSPAHWAALV